MTLKEFLKEIETNEAFNISEQLTESLLLESIQTENNLLPYINWDHSAITEKVWMELSKSDSPSFKLYNALLIPSQLTDYSEHFLSLNRQSMFKNQDYVFGEQSGATIDSSLKLWYSLQNERLEDDFMDLLDEDCYQEALYDLHTALLSIKESVEKRFVLKHSVEPLYLDTLTNEWLTPMEMIKREPLAFSILETNHLSLPFERWAIQLNPLNRWFSLRHSMPLIHDFLQAWDLNFDQPLEEEVMIDVELLYSFVSNS